jgi:hypothetical protein
MASTPISSIITAGLRETNLIPLGVAPTADQLQEAFDRLQSIVSSVLGNEMGENINPFPLGQDNITSPVGYPWWNNSLPGNLFVPTNARIMCNLTGEGFVNFHPKPHDGARMGIVDVSGNFNVNELTIFGNGRMIEGETEMTYNTAGETREWIYREDLGNWVVVVPLTQNGLMPFPSEFDDMFIIMLAMRLNPRYGQIMHPASVETLKHVTTKFTARYSQTTTQVPVESGLLYLTHWNRFWGYGAYGPTYGDPNDMFNSGFPY